jgi:8-oxo-dGTP pyrophosphatase MutT (NUDIX family)
LVKQREVQKWGFPKGSREWNETKLDCMTRELKEETGLVLNEHKHTIISCKNYFDSTIYFIQMDEPRDALPLSPRDTKEIEEAAWVSLSELKTLLLNRVTNHVKRNIILKSSWADFLQQNATPPLPIEPLAA